MSSLGRDNSHARLAPRASVSSRVRSLVWDGALLSLLTVVLLGLSGCDIRGGAPSGAAPNSPSDGGSIVGNGARTFTDARLPGVELTIPTGWDIRSIGDHAADSVLFDLRSPGPKQSVELKWLDRLGSSTPSMPNLRSFLGDNYPGVQWTRATLVTGEGYVGETFTGGVRTTRFFALDTVGRVLGIEVASSDAAHEADAWSIVRRLLKDNEPPRLESIHFEPRAATAGQRVKLVVIATDNGSGIAVQRLGGAVPVPSEDIEQPILGYNISHVRGTVGRWRAFPLTKHFVQVSRNRFEYELEIPDGAPMGKIIPVSLTITDHAGNATRALAIEAREDVPSHYLSLQVNGQIRPLPAYTVEEPAGAGGADPDTEPPKLKNVEFSTQFMTATDVQFLRISAADDGKLSDYASVKLVVLDKSGKRLGTCHRSSFLPVTLSATAGELHSSRLSLHDCVKTYQSQSPSEVIVDRVRLFDHVGNATECQLGRISAGQWGYCPLKTARIRVHQ